MEKIHTMFPVRKTMTCNGQLLDLSEPIVMGIINLSPDSFYRPSSFRFKYRIARRASQILEQGGQIIDVGACSTRPGSEPIPGNKELAMLSRALKVIRKHHPNAIISVDTFRAAVARKVVSDFGVNIINDISAGELDSNMLDTVAKLRTPYVLMHMKGTPANMQDNPMYSDVVHEVFSFFAKKIYELNMLGVNDIIIDPGFGFGKTVEHNYTLLNSLETFRVFNLPLMVGLSRKSMIYNPLGINPKQALNGTTAANTIAISNGASILRVHDVVEAVQAIRVNGLTIAQPRVV